MTIIAFIVQLAGATNATVLPSGVTTGFASSARCVVNRAAMPPWVGTIQRSPSDAKTRPAADSAGSR